ncbi:hypothetical protein Agub_g10204 [Astrephomene gubernaculifera]|uniref:C2 domain-containing protein n=1 Tax=Astrephomene gubernaculifera TaxID=47775 RepID=A0AAD3HPM3_9CHLO|nr:hypothetical protein Agub_g10204 [Astrephomene gubernaculifera]
MDVDIRINGCEGIPRMDVVGHADPYVILVITAPDGKQQFRYKTEVDYNTADPCWDEEISLRNVPPGTRCFFQIIDKDQLVRHDDIGTCELLIQPDACHEVKGCDNTSNAACSTKSNSSSRRSSSSSGSCALGRLSVSGAAATVTQSTAAVGTATVVAAATAAAWEQKQGSGSGGEGNCWNLRLPIRPAKSVSSRAGLLLLTVRCQPANRPQGPLEHCGPVRFRVSVSTVAGVLTGHTDEDGWLAYAAYKLRLAGVRKFFSEGATQHWNEKYDKARMIFHSSTMMAAVQAQHAVLYADNGQAKFRGTLRCGGDLVSLLHGGVRAAQRRYYTYCLLEDGSMCFSETGAAFFSDFMSKHAMHAGCADKVVFAGEFCLLPPGMPPVFPHPAASTSSSPSTHTPPPAVITAAQAAADAAAATAALPSAASNSRCRSPAPTDGSSSSSSTTTTANGAPSSTTTNGASTTSGGWTLVIDNNSGTYAPTEALLPALKGLLEYNFPGLQVEVVGAGEKARLEAYHARIPSRVKAC